MKHTVEAAKTPVKHWVPEIWATAHEAEQSASIESYVHYCEKAHAEARAEAIESKCSESEADNVAAAAWRCTLPLLSSRTAVQAFIACVAVGQQRGWIKPEESRSLMYTAQTALSVLRKAGA
ncbi:hypothetical protein [Paracidobacterium acidisoli]|uniref:Uncharacterized protein n=1 Tax=Paracidobacterium acidisoli TaxID=2303751 RepID=A0A372ILT5_9BACT|nr:hypothetical protein [Paracidobacterium acidisoli]MBT9332480.1 hypothetical protein [Paracidobacterium acidisoli]